MKYWWKRKIYNLIHRTYKNNWNLFKTSGAAWIIVGQDLRHLQHPPSRAPSPGASGAPVRSALPARCQEWQTVTLPAT